MPRAHAQGKGFGDLVLYCAKTINKHYLDIALHVVSLASVE